MSGSLSMLWGNEIKCPMIKRGNEMYESTTMVYAEELTDARSALEIDHQSVHVAPTRQPASTLERPQACPALPQLAKPLLLRAGNVVANGRVGFGAPLTVTVSTFATADG